MAADKRTARKKDVPGAPPPRNFHPRGIAGLLAPLVRPAFAKRAPAAAMLLADWAALAGPQLAGLAQPMKFSAGTLTLGCAGPAALELQHAAPAIMQRLNLGLGGAPVKRLRFVHQPPPPAARPAAAPTAPPAPPAGLPEGRLGEVLAKLHASVDHAAGPNESTSTPVKGNTTS